MNKVLTQSALAKDLSVSRETVCRAFSNHPKIGKKTRKRVLEYALEIGYKPNAAARIMQNKGKFGNIAHVSTSHWYGGDQSVVGNIQRFMPEVIRQASLVGTFVVPETFCVMEKQLRECPRIFTERCVDGIIAENNLSVPRELDKLLSQSGVPIVWINHRNLTELSFYSSMFFNPDEVDAGRQLAGHLIELGHKKIGFLTMGTDHFSGKDRYQGISIEVERAGLEPVVRLEVAHGAMYDPMQLDKFLGPQNGLTAVICYNICVATSMLTELCKRNRSVPRDLSLCYFAEEMAEYRLLDITRHISPDNRVATEAFKALQHLISNNIHSQNETIGRSFKGKLIVGATTAQPQRPRDVKPV